MSNFFDKDMGFKELVHSFEVKPGELAAFVGFLRSSGDHKNRPKTKGPKAPLTVAMIAAVMEYGSESRNIPARSYFWSTLKEHEEEIDAMLKKASIEVLLGHVQEKVALGLIAEWLKIKIRNKIDSNIPPPNTPATIAAKGGKDRTLVDSHQLVDSVDWEFKEGK